MRPGRLACTVLATLVLLAAGCGGSEGGDSGDGGNAATGENGDTGGGGGSNGGGGGGNGGGGDGDGEATFVLNTELDLGQPFAEDPMFDDQLGFVTVNARADRSGPSGAPIPIAFRLTNSGQADLEDVAVTIRFTVEPGPDPEDPPVPAPEDPALELTPQTTAGTCAGVDTTSSATAIACALGTLASGAEETITVTSPQWFTFSIGMELTAREP